MTRSNILGALNLVDCCYELGVHVSHFGSGCIYDQDEAHPLDGTGFTEDETPFYGGSTYSRTRLVSENVSRYSFETERAELTYHVGNPDLSERAHSEAEGPNGSGPRPEELGYQVDEVQQAYQHPVGEFRLFFLHAPIGASL